jgi:hypothetical protein
MSDDRLQTSHTDMRKSCQGEARHVEPRGDEQAKGSGWLPEYSETLRGGNVILCGVTTTKGASTCASSRVAFTASPA